MAGRLAFLAVSLSIILSCLAAEASMIKVLILDDVFQEIPAKGERIEKVGKLRGDLFVSGTHYVGDIEVWKGQGGMYLINELPLEDYVKNVVNAEVPPSWDMEALKVQAVIARTYALYQKSANHNGNFDLTSSVLHQVYKGNAVDARIAYAVMHTEGEVLKYKGNLIEALYHSTCGGETEDPAEVFGKSYPYMKPVSSHCELSPYWIWERKIPAEEIEKALDLHDIREIRIAAYTTTKRVKMVDILHRDGIAHIKATDLRKMLGWSRLPSTNFTVGRDNDAFVFEGKGYGHGVGLCQWSALEMAREGKTYREILSFFYPGTQLKVYEGR
ncbi:MAG: SpoIID/LytB domain-containing protein [Nitrospiraceae bacterium]|nr:SpoIID/LytB domain-containing protein [Nitrospiraceae bacterium]